MTLSVGWYAIPASQHEVTRHQVRRRHLRRHAVARRTPAPVATSICRRATRLRSALVLLDEAQERVRRRKTTAITTVSFRSPTSPASTVAPTSTTISRFRN